jgi:hypothetical protein
MLMKLTALFLLACAAMADEAKPKPINELEALKIENAWLKLENASLKLDLITKELEAIHTQRNGTIKEICAAAAIPIERCVIDPAKRMATAKEVSK